MDEGVYVIRAGEEEENESHRRPSYVVAKTVVAEEILEIWPMCHGDEWGITIHNIVVVVVVFNFLQKKTTLINDGQLAKGAFFFLFFLFFFVIRTKGVASFFLNQNERRSLKLRSY